MAIMELVTTSGALNILNNPTAREAISTEKMIEIFREKQLAIIRYLPDELRKEYLDLQAMIDAIEQEERRYAQGLKPHKVEVFSGPKGKKQYALVLKPRIPLSVHEENVIEAIRSNGPMPRGAILEVTGVPAGSLSAILKGKKFVRTKDGRWGLRKENTRKKKSGPSAPTAK
jgi:hypothetical protein